MTSSHLILWHPLLLLPSVSPSLRDFSSESALHIKWPKYWGFSFSVTLSNSYSGLISLKIAWCDLLALPGTPRSLLQHHSLKASVLWHPAFSAVQLSRLCVTTGKTTALTVWIFVGRVFCFWTHCLGVPSLSCREAVIWFRGCRHRLQRFWAWGQELCHCFHLFPLYLPWSDGADAMISVFFNIQFLAGLFSLLLHPHQEAL